VTSLEGSETDQVAITAFNAVSKPRCSPELCEDAYKSQTFAPPIGRQQSRQFKRLKSAMCIFLQLRKLPGWTGAVQVLRLPRTTLSCMTGRLHGAYNAHITVVLYKYDRSSQHQSHVRRLTTEPVPSPCSRSVARHVFAVRSDHTCAFVRNSRRVIDSKGQTWGQGVTAISPKSQREHSLAALEWPAWALLCPRS
jgi:hypothetical protein